METLVYIMCGALVCCQLWPLAKILLGMDKPKISPPIPKVKVCPLCCDYYRRGMIGKRQCLMEQWDELDKNNTPILLAETLEPIMPDTCQVMSGTEILRRVMAAARRKGWRK